MHLLQVPLSIHLYRILSLSVINKQLNHINISFPSSNVQTTTCDSGNLLEFAARRVRLSNGVSFHNVTRKKTERDSRPERLESIYGQLQLAPGCIASIEVRLTRAIDGIHRQEVAMHLHYSHLDRSSVTRRRQQVTLLRLPFKLSPLTLERDQCRSTSPSSSTLPIKPIGSRRS